MFIATTDLAYACSVRRSGTEVEGCSFRLSSAPSNGAGSFMELTYYKHFTPTG
jgi:hypothetical protein